ncbi:glycosyl transferase group 1 [Conexibacter woesei DSM 14684]|uniref:Glycosyl transferase group 1 n=1 Tax=Conexibacter woesei (strain DSM 14684 / CCUG 47730 / CIP 108061 / JCM 11494 / NBRC 100937 / ID131577) TaxID=469383 RepID=D3FFB5_CONWI|nr:glycosyl transferase group 1 [Conexibacter woesei DSM 14684]
MAVAVAQVGPDPEGRGGMAAVTRGLLDSPLAERYRLTPIVTYRAGAPLRGLPVFARGLAQLVRWQRANPGGIVHVHSAVRGSLYRKALVVELARLLRNPVILHVHAGAGDIQDFVAGRRRLELRAFRATFARATRVVTVSAAGAVALQRAFGRDDIAVVPNAVPAVELPEPSANGRPGVLYLGGFEDPAKGGAVLVRAVPALLRAQADVEVMLAGPGEPPAALSALDGGRVRWLGWLDPEAKARAFAAAEVVTLPSISEGLPVALLEAMAHGRAIVASRVGGMPEVLEDGREALLVDPDDSDALADAIVALLRDPERRSTLGAAARARVSGLSEPAVTRQLDELYREVLTR